MKKVLSALILGCAFTASLSAFTWSGLIDNNTKIAKNLSNTGVQLNQSNGIFLSMATPINKNLSFSAEGLYKYSYTKADDVSTFTNIVDVDLLKLGGTWGTASGFANLSLGRFFISDASSAVFAQTCDGIYFSTSIINWSVALYAGYTGLLNSLNVSMTALNTNTNDQFYNLSAGYIPLSAELSYGALFGTDVLGLQAMYFLEPKQELPSLFYGTVTLNGSISTIGTYSLAATLGSSEFKNLMMYAKADMMFFTTDSLILGIGAEYASGEQGAFTSFKTVTAKTACNYAGGYPLSGVLLPKLTATYAVNGLYANLTEKFVCLMPSDELKYSGFDTTFTILYNLFSDFQIGLDCNAYIDVNNSDSNYFGGTFKASLTF